MMEKNSKFHKNPFIDKPINFIPLKANNLKIKLSSIIYLFVLIFIGQSNFIAEAQKLHQVYMINHRTASSFHAFSRVDRDSLIEAIENMGLAAFPCGVELLRTRNEISSIVFHFQLYRACPLTGLQEDEDPTPLLSQKSKELIGNSRLNFKELAQSLQDFSNFNQNADVTFMKEDKMLKKVVNLHEPIVDDESKSRDLKSLYWNFTSYRPTTSRQKRSSLADILDLENVNFSSSSYTNKLLFLGANEEEEKPDLDYYADLTAEDIEMEALVFMESLKESNFSKEGCASQRLEPLDNVRVLKPFSGDGYIVNEVLGEILNMVKNKPEDHYLININYRPIKCFILCTTSTPLTTSTSVCGGIQPNDFESGSQNELWSFINSEQIDDALAASKHAHLFATPYVPPNRVVNKEDNFRIVVGSVQNSSNHYAYFSSREPKLIVPMIVSTYFQHTSSQCELVFKHRVHGIPGSELIVSTQHLEHRALLVHENEHDDEEADDWVRPTLRASFKPVRDDHEQWTTSRVSIGQTVYPTRIRIECHTAQQQRDMSLLNVECNVDQLNLVNCDEEIWKADVCSSKQSKKYLCHKKGPQKCIDYSDVCDMHAECEDGEDESDEVNKCSSVPPGARCDFELNSDTGCPHWKFFSPSMSSNSQKNGSQYLQRVSLSNTRRLPTHGLPPSDYIYHGSKRVAGHFLFFSTYGLSSDYQPNGEVLYTYAITPSFPPTSLATSLVDSPSYRTCMVRFFYCQTGTSTFQLMLENGADFSHKEVLWTPPKATGSEPCTWEKASASIPHQDTEYRLKIAFGKLYKQPVSVAVDDFTMTPNCFLELQSWSARYVPERLKIETCSDKDCKDPYSDSTGTLITNDKRSWLVPTSGLYHIQLFGAAGGKLPGQETKNLGGILAANLRLQHNQELSFVVGSMGMNPCEDEKRTFAGGHGKSNLDRLWRVICTKESASSSDFELARRDVQNLFGSSGGGATALFSDNQLIAVAGAGGGLFPESFILSTDNKSNPSGGEFFDVDNKSYTMKQSSSNWAAGNGANFDPKQQQPNNQLANCADCFQMTGQSIMVKERRQFLGGQCPRGRHYNISGAYGGGAASCGPGAGGGAGFQGGNAGLKSHAEGGSSAFLLKGAQIEWLRGMNPAEGRILIIRCTLKCPTNSTCVFENPKPGMEAGQFCQCTNGRKIGVGKNCGPSDLSSILSRFRFAIDDAVDVEPGIGLYIIIIIFALLLIIPICICYLFMRLRYDCGRRSKLLRRLKMCLFPKQSHDEFGDMYEMNSRVGGGNSVMERSQSTVRGNLIKENPIYERLVMIELPHISRHFIQLKKSIGHGAFGEVFEGFFNLDGSITKVAVKTLPIDSNPETDCDFETEARLLNQFNHPNIVKFYGVSFEQQPKYIILEYLEGGDLRNFLRECRPKPNSPLDEPQPLGMLDLIHMALDVAHGCTYLENSKFIHRDIAARNILLTTKGPDRIAKIADFGMARDIFSSEYYRKGGRAFLAVKWLPPEGFLDGIFNSKTDVWAYGILLWEIFSMGYMPYTLRQNQEVMQLVVAGGRLEPPVGVPEKIYDQMLNCWHTEPEERPNFTQIVDFFTDLATDTQLMELPVPPILYRQSQHTPSGTPSTTRSSIPPMDDIVTSQATMSTNMASSMTESTTNSSVSMPTQGEGINHNVFPAYQPRFSQPLMEIRPNNHQLIRDSSLSSHDDSTLHDTCSVKQSPYRIDKSALKALQAQAMKKPMPLPESMPLLTSDPQSTTSPPPKLPPKNVSPDSHGSEPTDLSPCQSGDSGLQSPTPRTISAPQKADDTFSEEQTSPLV